MFVDAATIRAPAGCAGAIAGLVVFPRLVRAELRNTPPLASAAADAILSASQTIQTPDLIDVL